MLKAKKKEKKVSLDKANKKLKKQKETSLFSNTPDLIELLIPDMVEEKRDYIVLGENRYSRSFILSAYPSKIFLGWLDHIFNLLR